MTQPSTPPTDRTIPFKILNCSSESNDHNSNNLYKNTSMKKNPEQECWQTNPETTKAELLLGLSAPTNIRSVIIENANSALIEILAGNKNQDLDTFVPIVPVHCLMTNQQVKSETNRFGAKQIRCNSIGNNKYDRLRVVVRQYKPSVFGLSSIKLSASYLSQNPATSPTKGNTVTQKEAEITPKLQINPSNPNTQEEIVPTRKNTKPEQKESPRQMSDEKPPNKTQASRKNAPGSKPLSGVTIVISGIVNPRRTDIREKALGLGAGYLPEWGPKATHLICPSWNEEKCLLAKKANKPIVKPDWIDECDKKKQNVEIEEYVLENNKKAKSERRRSPRRHAKAKKEYAEDSEEFDDISDGSIVSNDQSSDEDWDKSSDDDKPARKKKKLDIEDLGDWGIDEGTSFENDDKPSKKLEAAPIRPRSQKKSEEHSKPPQKKEKKEESESGTEEMDAEEIETEISKPAAKITSKSSQKQSVSQKLSNSPSFSSKNQSPSIPPPGKQGPINPLPDFLKGVNCYICTQDESVKHNITKLVIAYDGVIDKFLYTNTTHLVTDGDWQPSFNKVQEQMSNINIVNSLWVDECHNQQRLVDTHDFLIPDD